MQWEKTWELQTKGWHKSQSWFCIYKLIRKDWCNIRSWFWLIDNLIYTVAKWVPEHYQFRNNPHSWFRPQLLFSEIFVINLWGGFYFRTAYYASSVTHCGMKNHSLQRTIWSGLFTSQQNVAVVIGHGCLQSMVWMTWVTCMHPSGTLRVSFRWKKDGLSCENRDVPELVILPKVTDRRNGHFMNGQATSKLGCRCPVCVRGRRIRICQQNPLIFVP